MIDCDHSESVGAYVLDALGEPAASEFAAHVETCEACRTEVAKLQVVADTLPLAAPQMAPSRALKDRIMTVVESEAQLLRAAGAGADRAPVAAPRPRRWMPRLTLRPAAALAGLAGAAVVAVVLSQSGGSDSRTVSASLAPAGSQVAVKVTGDRAQLSVAGMPSPSAGRVYEVWLIRAGHRPQPTHALFGVRRDGRAVVTIPDSVRDADAVWVTAEPSTGSTVPTSEPVIKASLA